MCGPDPPVLIRDPEPPIEYILTAFWFDLLDNMFTVQVLLASAMGEAESSLSVADDETALEQIMFVSSVLTFIIIAIGILGNVLSLVVLTRPKMKVRIIPSKDPTVRVLLPGISKSERFHKIYHFCGLRTFCNSPKTPTQWKSGSDTDQLTDRSTY